MAAIASRLLRARLLHYLLLGGLLLAARPWLAQPWSQLVSWRQQQQPSIVIGAAERALIRERLQLTAPAVSAAGQPVVDPREQTLIDEAIDDELLYRAALERGLDAGNPVVRERVVQDMRLLSEDVDADEETLFREGLKLGLDRSDLVVRRQLAATMRLMASSPARKEAASDQELAGVIERHRERFERAATTSLVHVFASRRRRGADAGAFALQLLGELRADSVASAAWPDDAFARADAFALGHRLRERSDGDLDAVFGRGFAAAVRTLPEGEWAGPIASSYGFHLVWVQGRSAARLPELAAVRGSALELLHSERSEQRLAAWLARERARYQIRIDAPRTAPALLQQASLPVASLALPRAAAVVGD